MRRDVFFLSTAQPIVLEYFLNMIGITIVELKFDNYLSEFQTRKANGRHITYVNFSSRILCKKFKLHLTTHFSVTSYNKQHLKHGWVNEARIVLHKRLYLYFLSHEIDKGEGAVGLYVKKKSTYLYDLTKSPNALVKIYRKNTKDSILLRYINMMVTFSFLFYFL